jgi:hypothetical protein
MIAAAGQTAAVGSSNSPGYPALDPGIFGGNSHGDIDVVYIMQQGSGRYVKRFLARGNEAPFGKSAEGRGG